MSITIKDVAKRVGVTPATVSMVINHKPRISDETRRKVMEAIEELDYFPHAGARSLVLQRTQTVGVAAPLFSTYSVLEMLAGIEQEAAASGYDLVLYGSHGAAMAEDDVITRIARERKVDGLIVVDKLPSPKQLGYFSKNNVAIVGLDCQLEGWDSVLVDHAAGAYEATRHLLSLGHRRIAMVNGPANFGPSKARDTGYRQALAEAKLNWEPSLSFQVAAGHREEGFDVGEKLLKLRSAPTAVLVAAGDVCATGVILALKKNGMAVPQQISVVGFDDQPFASLMDPALTTVRQPLTKVGGAAFQLLRQAMQAEQGPRRAQKLVFQAELIVRASTAAAPAR
jgi:DNA-binding LacI/PurR family transcriptional regulator